MNEFIMVVVILAAIWFLYEVYTQPVGYQDEDEFHYGVKPVEEDTSHLLTTHAQLLRHAASALETPNDLTRNERYELIEDLLIKANELDPIEE
jgi:hypothetical protein